MADHGERYCGAEAGQDERYQAMEVHPGERHCGAGADQDKRHEAAMAHPGERHCGAGAGQDKRHEAAIALPDERHCDAGAGQDKRHEAAMAHPDERHWAAMAHPDERHQLQDIHDERIERDIAFIGSTLAPFFLHDPTLEADAVLPLLEALSEADPVELSTNWPFVHAANEAAVRPSLCLLIEGASLCFAASETDKHLDPPEHLEHLEPPERTHLERIHPAHTNLESPEGPECAPLAHTPPAHTHLEPHTNPEHTPLSQTHIVAADTNELARDYRRLFVGPAKKEAPQWGSIYTDKDQVTFGASTMQLEEWLAENRIMISFGANAMPSNSCSASNRPSRSRDASAMPPNSFGANNEPPNPLNARDRLPRSRDASDKPPRPRGASDEPPDSLGALLALLAWLADEKPWLIADFLRLHVLPWSSHFLDLMEEKAEHPFYKGLAGITRFSLEGAGEALGLKVEKPRFYR